MVLVDLMERHIPMKHLAQDAVREQGVQALVVVQEACGALSNGEPLGEVLPGEIFEREFWVVLNRVDEGRQLEQTAYAAVGCREREFGTGHCGDAPGKGAPGANRLGPTARR